MIISNSCFDNNTFKQNTMEIWDEKEDSVKNVKTLPMWNHYGDPPFQFYLHSPSKNEFFHPSLSGDFEDPLSPMKKGGAHWAKAEHFWFFTENLTLFFHGTHCASPKLPKLARQSHFRKSQQKLNIFWLFTENLIQTYLWTVISWKQWG